MEGWGGYGDTWTSGSIPLEQLLGEQTPRSGLLVLQGRVGLGGRCQQTYMFLRIQRPLKTLGEGEEVLEALLQTVLHVWRKNFVVDMALPLPGWPGRDGV